MPDYNNPIDMENPGAIPPTPMKLRALPVPDNNTVQLTFEYAYQNAVGVVVERSERGRAFSAVDTIPFPATSGIDSSGTSDSTVYLYRIYAINANGGSETSNTATCTTGVFVPADVSGPSLILLHEGNPVTNYKTITPDVLELKGIVGDPSGVAWTLVDGDTVSIDADGGWSSNHALTRYRTEFTFETGDSAVPANVTRDTLTIYYDVPNAPPRTAIDLSRTGRLTLTWQPCHDYDFIGFAVWSTGAPAVDTTTAPDTVYRGSEDTVHFIDAPQGTDITFRCAIMDSASNYVMGPHSGGQVRGGRVFRHTMARVPAGTLRYDDSLVAHVTRDIYVDTVEVTQEYFQEVTGYNIARFTGPQRPVESLNWFDAVRFCNERSRYHGFDTVYSYTELRGDDAVDLQCHWNRNGYRLPTADEWEYFARAGVRTNYFCGNTVADSAALDTCVLAYAWNRENTVNAPPGEEPPYFGSQEVGRKMPNALSIYDVLGNASEWVWDNYWKFDSLTALPSGRIDYAGPSYPACCDEANDGPARTVMGTYWNQGALSMPFGRLQYVAQRQRSYVIGIRLVQTAEGQ